MDPHHGSGYDADGVDEDRDAIFPHGDSAWFEPGRGPPASEEGGSSHLTIPVRVGLLGSEQRRPLDRRRRVPRLPCWVQRGAPHGTSSDLRPCKADETGRIRDVPSMESSACGPHQCDHWRRIQPTSASSTSGCLRGPRRLVLALCTNAVTEPACSLWEEPQPAYTPVLFGRCRRL